MTTPLGLPRGAGASLVSFGSSNATPSAGDRLILSGTGAVSSVPMNNPPQLLIGGLDAFEFILGAPFAPDKTGMGAMPFKEPVISWTYYVKGTSWADLETRLNRLYVWYWSTYSYTNAAGSLTYSGASGQKGDLLVKNAAGVTWVAPATWLSFPDKIPPGQVMFQQVELIFRITDHFTTLP